MATHGDPTERDPLHAPGRPSRRSLRMLSPLEWVTVASGAGLLWAVVAAAPLWDWLQSAHGGLELTMVTSARLFGLHDFSHATYVIGPLAVGLVLLCVYGVASGADTTGVADRARR